MMPFRLPMNYENLGCVSRDPTDGELAEYVAWLETELETAKGHQEARDARKEAASE